MTCGRGGGKRRRRSVMTADYGQFLQENASRNCQENAQNHRFPILRLKWVMVVVAGIQINSHLALERSMNRLLENDERATVAAASHINRDDDSSSSSGIIPDSILLPEDPSGDLRMILVGSRRSRLIRKCVLQLLRRDSGSKRRNDNGDRGEDSALGG